MNGFLMQDVISPFIHYRYSVVFGYGDNYDHLRLIDMFHIQSSSFSLKGQNIW